jgi:hypothetical protein
MEAEPTFLWTNMAVVIGVGSTAKPGVVAFLHTPRQFKKYRV